MNDLINIGGIKVSARKEFQNPALTEATNRIFAIYKDASVFVEAKNREIAIILSGVKANKAYVQDGYKSVADYAEQVFGMGKQSAYALASAGDVYTSDTASAELRQFSPSKLAELSKVDSRKLEEDISAGVIDANTTQKDLRTYARNARAPKAVVVDLYTARMVGYSMDDMPIFVTTPRTIDDWDMVIVDWFREEYAPTRDVEIVKLSKAAPFTDPLSEKKTVLRRLYLSEDMDVVVEFYLYKPVVAAETSPVSAKKVTDLTLDDLRALLAQKELEASTGKDADTAEEPRPFD